MGIDSLCVSVADTSPISSADQELLAKYQKSREEYFVQRFGSAEAGEQYFAQMADRIISLTTSEEQSGIYRPTNPYIPHGV